MDPLDGRPHLAAQRLEQFGLAGRDPLFGTKHLGLVLLKLRGDVALRRGQRLAPLVIGRHLGALGVGDLDVVAEDFVVAHLERRDPGPFPLPLLDRRDVLLAAVAKPAGLVQHGVVLRPDHPALRQGRRGPFGQRGLQLRGQVFQEVELVAQLGQGVIRRRFEGGENPLQLGQPEEGVAEDPELPRSRPVGGGPAGQPLQVADPVENFAGLGPGQGLADGQLDRVEAAPNLGHVTERGEEPVAQQPGAERSDGAVQHFQQGDAAGSGAERLHQLQVAPGHLVQPEIALGAAHRRPPEVGQAAGLELGEVAEDAAGGA